MDEIELAVIRKAKFLCGFVVVGISGIISKIHF
jgi:hypothetical protein